MNIYLVVSYKFTGADNKIEDGQELLGPFNTPAKVNAARRTHIYDHNKKGYNHTYVFVAAESLQLIDVPRDDGDSHPYRVHLQSGGILRLYAGENWEVKRNGVKIADINPSGMKPGDEIFVRRKNRSGMETITHVDKIELSWNHDREEYHEDKS